MKIKTSVDGNKCAKNCCKRIILVQLIVENVVTFFETQCITYKPYRVRQKVIHSTISC